MNLSWRFILLTLAPLWACSAPPAQPVWNSIGGPSPSTAILAAVESAPGGLVQRAAEDSEEDKEDWLMMRYAPRVSWLSSPVAALSASGDPVPNPGSIPPPDLLPSRVTLTAGTGTETATIDLLWVPHGHASVDLRFWEAELGTIDADGDWVRYSEPAELPSAARAGFSSLVGTRRCLTTHTVTVTLTTTGARPASKLVLRTLTLYKVGRHLASAERWIGITP